MKNILVLFLTIPFLFVSCKKLDKLTQFEMKFNETVVVPASSGIHLPFNLFTPEIHSNAETTLSVNDTRKEYVEEIKVTHLDITLELPASGDLSFLKSIEIFLSAEGLPEIKIAWKAQVPADTGQYLELETTDANLKDYILKEKFSLRVSTVTDEILTSDHHLEIHSVFFVDAKILGQ